MPVRASHMLHAITNALCGRWCRRPAHPPAAHVPEGFSEPHAAPYAEFLKALDATAALGPAFDLGPQLFYTNGLYPGQRDALRGIVREAVDGLAACDIPRAQCVFAAAALHLALARRQFVLPTYVTLGYVDSPRGRPSDGYAATTRAARGAT